MLLMFAGTVQDQIMDISRCSLSRIPLPVMLLVSQELPMSCILCANHFTLKQQRITVSVMERVIAPYSCFAKLLFKFPESD